MFSNIKNVLVNEDGATLVEYALIVSLIAVACIAVVRTLGTTVSSSFTSIGTAVGGA